MAVALFAQFQDLVQAGVTPLLLIFFAPPAEIFISKKASSVVIRSLIRSCISAGVRNGKSGGSGCVLTELLGSLEAPPKGNYEIANLILAQYHSTRNTKAQRHRGLLLCLPLFRSFPDFLYPYVDHSDYLLNFLLLLQ